MECAPATDYTGNMNEIQPERPTLLLVEDDVYFRETLVLEFQERGYTVFEAATHRDIDALSVSALRFAIVDLRLGAEWGLDCVARLKVRWPEVRILVLTGYGSIATAVEAVRLGADNYLTKPISMDTLERALWTDDVQAEEAPNRESLARHEREYIEYVLVQCEGNITHAAEWLGIHRQSLQRKLRKLTPP